MSKELDNAIGAVKKQIDLEDSALIKDRDNYNVNLYLLEREKVIIDAISDMLAEYNDKFKLVSATLTDIKYKLSKDKKMLPQIDIPFELTYTGKLESNLKTVTSKYKELYKDSCVAREKSFLATSDSRRANLQILRDSLMNLISQQSQLDKVSSSPKYSFTDIIANLKTSLKATNDETVKKEIQEEINRLVKANLEYIKTFDVKKG